ncbi:MAG: 1-deoxy-D-xylulose-5-phosphate synthase [Synergistetes bacterium]|nr:1-deoxy-D-xylulose-5-phosphate synthase [Synergistota bacterium]
MSLLEGIKSPSDIRSLDYRELEELSREIRERLIDVVSRTGGHLASNLGVVELTIALHRVFDTPKDKVVWDVSHQVYVHKMLTGRMGSIDTIRQLNGLSGFAWPPESEYDVFAAGHAGTAISAAMGIAEARDKKKEDFEVVAVVGDASITTGMSLEALNHLGSLGTKIIIVLNDNKWSISPRVGGIARHLSRIRSIPTYQRLKEEIKREIAELPLFGGGIFNVVDRVKETLKYLIMEGSIFEQMGLLHWGPVDGHDIRAVEELLRNAKEVDRPVVVHVLTEKGKGYKFASENPEQFHGVGPFDKTTGSLKKSGAYSYSQVFGMTVEKLAERDNRVVAMTAGMREGAGLFEFSKRFPDRFYDVGIAEQHLLTFAAGMALNGMRPFVAIYSTFLQRAYDQFIHDICLQGLPVVLCVDRAGIVGSDGATHQGVFDIAYLRVVPNVTIMAPKDERELQNMLFTALEIDGPVVIRYPRGSGVGVELNFDDFQKVEIGKGETLKEGRKLILAFGSMVLPSMRVADRYPAGFVGVVNMRFIKPLDGKLILDVVKRAEEVIVAEEGVRMGGVGEEVVELVNEEGLDSRKIKIVALPDVFVPHGSQGELRKIYGVDEHALEEALFGKDSNRQAVG